MCSSGLAGSAANLPAAPVLIGDSVLCRRYAHALSYFGRSAALQLDNTAPAGLWQVARSAGLLGVDEEPYTILSRRGYLCDASFTVCLWGVKDTLPYPLETLAEALRRPVFTPYLGRKCCPPSLPFAPEIGDFENVEAALAAYTLDAWRFASDKDRPATVLLVADEDAAPAVVLQRPLIRDRTTHHGRRQFAERRAVMASIAPGVIGKKEAGHVSQ